jgi:protein-disulfide isomerase
VFWILLLLSVSCQKSAPTRDAPIFSYKGKEVKINDLSDEHKSAAFDAERRYQQELESIADQYVVKAFLAEEAKKSGKTPEALEAELLAPAPPSDEEIRKFYEAKKDKIPYPFDVVKKELRNVMTNDRRFFAKSDLVSKARAAGDFKFLIEKKTPPKVKVHSEGRPWKGTEDASVTVVEFADYRCPHCAEAFQKLKTVFPKYENKIRFVFMDFPLQEQEDGDSFLIAKGAYCAKQQEKFWEYHDLAYQQSATLSKDSPAALAKTLQLNAAKFDTCLQSADAAEYVRTSRKEGTRLNIRGTPSFFVNGVKINSDGELRGLQTAINEAL